MDVNREFNEPLQKPDLEIGFECGNTASFN